MRFYDSTLGQLIHRRQKYDLLSYCIMISVNVDVEQAKKIKLIV